MAREEKGSVEGLKDKLYSRATGELADPDERTPLSPGEAPPESHWEQTSLPDLPQHIFSMTSRPHTRKRSPTLMFFGGSLAFFVVALGVAAYIFFAGGNSISPKNIDLQIVMPSVIDGGKESELQILINNRNQTALKLVDLVITYPEGTRDPKNPSKPLLRERQSIGTLSSGEQTKRTARAIFYGQEGQNQQVSVQLQYSVEGSNSIFERDALATFVVGSSPVSITLTSPSEAIAGQQFVIELAVQSNAEDLLENVVVKGQYPFGFSLQHSSPSASAGGTLWRLGSLKPGESKKIRLTGAIEGQDGDARVFYFLAGSNADATDTTIKVPFLSVPHTLTVRRAFIGAQISVNGQTGKTVTVSQDGHVQGTVTWTNNLPDPVSDVAISLGIKGPMLDTGTVQSPTGFYQSSNSTIVWSKDQNQMLQSVAPGETGTLQFSFSLKPTGTGGTVYSNPVIDLNLSVSGVRQGGDSVPGTVSSAASTAVLVSSKATVRAAATYAGIGSNPPRAESPTTYTITWTANNSSNTIANATMSATLPQYVTFGSATPGSGITYDTGSRTVTWTMGDVKAGTGYTSAARTASFQVVINPSASQVGQSPALTSSASFGGQDRFAQVNVQASAEAPSTDQAVAPK